MPAAVDSSIPERSERLIPAQKLRRRVDYQRCYQTGRRQHGSVMTLHSIPNQLDHPRLGVTTTRKVGGAVVRQKLRRRVREIYRRWAERERLPAVDLVVHLKPAAAGASFSQLESELQRLLLALLARWRAVPAQ